MRENKLKPNYNKDKFFDSVPLPQDILRGDVRITVTGNREIWVENYKGLLEYTNNSIIIQAKTCKIQFEGKCLNIDYYTNEDMKVSGRITNIKYF